MISEKEITTLYIDGEKVSAIRLGTKECGLPAHLFQNEKKDGYLIHDGEISTWTWTNIYYEGIDRYVYFPYLELSSLEEIATTKRGSALKIVKNIAKGLSEAKSDFLNLATGVFPLYRIFIVGEEDVLLLPPDIGDILALLRSPEERRDEVNVLISRNAEKNFLLILEMAELLYFAATGFLPYMDEDVRHWKYREFPLENALSAFGEALDMKALGFINFIMHAKTRNMKDIAGNRDGSMALSWFLKYIDEINWNLTARDEIADVEVSPEWASWKEKTEKGAGRSNFWRKRGTIITVCVIVGAFLSTLIGEWIYNALQPPVTKDYTQEEIVSAIYQSQNDIDPELLQAPLKGITLPQETEVMNLFVTTRVRTAYEPGKSPVIDPIEWRESGKDALSEGQIIYGVENLVIERVSDKDFLATADWYMPHYDEEPADSYDPTTAEPSMKFDIVRTTQSFHFEWNKRGWWNITDSAITDSELIGIIEIPIVPLSEDRARL